MALRTLTCPECGSPDNKEIRHTVDAGWKDYRLFVVNAPAFLCANCNCIFFDGGVAETMLMVGECLYGLERRPDILPWDIVLEILKEMSSANR